MSAAAVPAEGASPPEEPLLLVVFRLAGQRYGLSAADVAEVQRMVAVVPLPGAPDVVEGVVELRGSLVAALDVRQRFALTPKPIELTDHLVIARAATRTVALRVDAVLGLVEVPRDAVDTEATDLPGVVHVAGVAHDDDGLVLLHDLATFLSLDEGRRLDDALAGSAGS